MPISDKTRKILWGRSGNRCAFCRRELVIDSSAGDDESVVGDECHILSSKTQGPRYDPAFPGDRFNELENLILLCRVHHKMVDDQCDTYIAELLQKIKSNHEKWVSSSLNDRKEPPPVRIRRIKENIPSHLVRLTTGQDVINIIDSAMAYSFFHDEPKSESEAEIFGNFFQEAQDWGDLSHVLEPYDRVKAAYRMSEMLQELSDAGFLVFGGREIRRMEGGIGSPSEFAIAILKVVHSTSPEIIQFNAGEGEVGTSQSTKPSSSNPGKDKA